MPQRLHYAHMNDLWSSRRQEAREAVAPLALRMRPRSLHEYAGQHHIIGASDQPPTLLRRMISAGTLTSLILHGPPGTGKTTLAQVIANETGRHMVRENAAAVGVKRIREILEDAARRIEETDGSPDGRTILFLDEIHRFTKAQQDVLLGDVERGIITLIGATTENPLFAVNAALVSRSTLFRLEPLSDDDITEVLRQAIADPQRGYGSRNITVDDDAMAHWAAMSDGDARRALNALEVAVLSGGADPVHIDLATAQESIQHKAIVYDGTGDEHYDAISAMIKSVRGCDPDAAVYWIAVMLEAGEDPRFIARRLAILASEDIGNADPRAIVIADSCWSLVERIGMPECRIPLSQCATYLALAPKSNAAYVAIDEAMADVREGRTRPIPVFLRDGNKPHSEGSARDGRGYEYSHNASMRTSIGGITGQDYLGVDRRYYRPLDIGAERVLRERLDEVQRARRDAETGDGD